MMHPRPTFLGIGAHKAGTGWLYQQLRRHPEIWMPPRKELHFFDRDPRYPTPNSLATADLRDRLLGSNPWERPRVLQGSVKIAKHLVRGRIHDAAWWSRWIFGHYDESWYSALFEQAGARICGEISPGYSILDREEIARIAAVNPAMKLIFMIRNPIERGWSAIRYNVDRGRLTLDLDAADGIIAFLEKPHVRLRADYEGTLERYLERFDRRQILVCFYDAIQHDPVGLMSGIAAFLGVAPFPERDIDSRTRINASPARPMPRPVNEYLCETYGPMIERLAERYGSYARRWTEAASTGWGCPGSSAELCPTFVP